MSRKARPLSLTARRQQGFTLVEMIVASSLLSIVSTIILGGLLYSIKAASQGQDRGGAAAWVQAEVDFLRVQGYTGLADDVTAGTRTLTATTGYTTYGALPEPTIPGGFNRATVRVEDISGLLVRKIIIKVYETAGPAVYATLVTYVANHTYP